MVAIKFFNIEFYVVFYFPQRSRNMLHFFGVLDFSPLHLYSNSMVSRFCESDLVVIDVRVYAVSQSIDNIYSKFSLYSTSMGIK